MQLEYEHNKMYLIIYSLFGLLGGFTIIMNL